MAHVQFSLSVSLVQDSFPCIDYKLFVRRNHISKKVNFYISHVAEGISDTS